MQDSHQQRILKSSWILITVSALLLSAGLILLFEGISRLDLKIMGIVPYTAIAILTVISICLTGWCYSRVLQNEIIIYKRRFRWLEIASVMLSIDGFLLYKLVAKLSTDVLAPFPFLWLVEFATAMCCISIFLNYLAGKFDDVIPAWRLM